MNVAATTEPTPAPPGSQEALSSLLCDVLPSQGTWGDREYLWLTDHTNRLIELTDGHVPELPMPTDTHQAVLLFVGPDDPDRDLVDKRAGYAAAGIAEYWIADPRHDTITVLTLDGGTYVEHGMFARGEAATSPSLSGFAVDVSAVFDAPDSDE